MVGHARRRGEAVGATMPDESERVRELEDELERARARAAGAAPLHRRAELMLSSMLHRMRNMLALVRSLSSNTAAHADDLADFSAHFDGRLGALARCLNILARGGGDKADLEELLREEFLAQTAKTANIDLDGPGVQLAPRQAEAFAIAIHELATNSIKFGALSHNGALRVHWRLNGDKLDFNWNEQLEGPADLTARRDGFGRDFIERGLPFQIGAHTEFDIGDDFIRCRIACRVDPPGAGA